MASMNKGRTVSRAAPKGHDVWASGGGSIPALALDATGKTGGPDRIVRLICYGDANVEYVGPLTTWIPSANRAVSTVDSVSDW
jgi:hypothetical protein